MMPSGPDRSVIRASFTGSQGFELSARVDLPAGPVRAFALFAHCFTCSKDVVAAKRIASGLAAAGIGVLRFDFTGLGSSEGEFANTNFSSNVEDLVNAATYLREHFAAPAMLVSVISVAETDAIRRKNRIVSSPRRCHMSPSSLGPDTELCTPSPRSQMQTSESSGHGQLMIVVRSLDLKFPSERAAA